MPKKPPHRALHPSAAGAGTLTSASGVQHELDAVRQVAVRWTRPVAASDLEQLGRLMADDIIVVHSNGRSLAGRDAVLKDFASSFERYQVNQDVVSEETIVTGDWAFDRARVRTSISQRAGREFKEVLSRTVTLLRREPVRGWCVARAIGVVEQVDLAAPCSAQHRAGPGRRGEPESADG
jgi:uncharacterized protein (TIGR02246 family)